MDSTPEKPQINYFQKYLAEEFAEDYQEGRISRRKALKLIASVTGSVVMANSILAACVPIPPTPQQPPAASTAPAATATQEPSKVPTNPPTPSSTPAALPSATAAPPAATGTTLPQAAGSNATVSPNDPAVEGRDVEFPAKEGGSLRGYLARPKEGSNLPVVLVCHENRGLTDYIRDVTRRLAKAGYVGLAVDLLSRQGGTSKLGADAVPGALGSIAPEQFVRDFQSGYAYLKTLPYAQAERAGMVGFCFGGGVTWQAAVNMPELQAAVPFYGPQPPVTDVPKIKAAILAFYGEKDSRINQGIPPIEAAMQQNQKTFEKMIYPGADHAFHNDTGTRYNPEAAADAWIRTLAWFKKYLV